MLRKLKLMAQVVELKARKTKRALRSQVRMKHTNSQSHSNIRAAGERTKPSLILASG